MKTSARRILMSAGTSIASQWTQKEIERLPAHNKQLSRLMEAHGVSYNVEREWVVPHGALAAARASWYARVGSGVLQVDVLLENKSVINECFAGIGDGAEGICDALQNFMANSLHVLLAAFWGRDDAEQVTTQA